MGDNINPELQNILDRIVTLLDQQQQSSERHDLRFDDLQGLIVLLQQSIVTTGQGQNELSTAFIVHQQLLTRVETGVKNLVEQQVPNITEGIQQLRNLIEPGLPNINNNQGLNNNNNQPTQTYDSRCGGCNKERFRVPVTLLDRNGKPRFRCSICDNHFAAGSYRTHIKKTCYPKNSCTVCAPPAPAPPVPP